MNRFEFYDRLRQYKDNGSNSLMHSNGSQNYDYYMKLDKYYKDGSPRYFYTKESWDAYQKNLQLSNQAKDKEKLDKQKKEQYEKNKAASEHEADRFKKPTKIQQSDKKQYSYSAEQAEKEVKNRELFEAKKRGKLALIKSSTDIIKDIYDNFDIKKYYNEGDDPQTVLDRIKKDGIFDKIQKNMKILYDNDYITFDNSSSDGNGNDIGWTFKDGSIYSGFDVYEKIKDASWEYKDLGSIFSKLLSKNFEDKLYPPNYDPNKIYISGNAVFPDEIKEYAKSELGVDLSGDKQKILTKEQYKKINDYRKKIFS